MNSHDAIIKALTPGDMFNQKGLVWRSVSTLTQFASCETAEVLDILDEHFQGLVTVRPNTSHPERGPLVALNAFIPADQPEAGAPQVQIADVPPAPGAVGVAIMGHGDGLDVDVAVDPAAVEAPIAEAPDDPPEAVQEDVDGPEPGSYL